MTAGASSPASTGPAFGSGRTIVTGPVTGVASLGSVGHTGTPTLACVNACIIEVVC